MAKFKVLKTFKDKDKGNMYVPKDIVDFTVDRADDLNKKGDYLKRIEEPKKKKATPKK